MNELDLKPNDMQLGDNVNDCIVMYKFFRQFKTKIIKK